MAILNIVKEGDEVLRKRCKEITEITPKIKTLIGDMKDTLRKAEGAGLAAPQVGILKRLVLVVDENGEYLTLINPKIVAYHGEQNEVEGCLSIPGQWGIVQRPLGVTVEALNENGEKVTYSRQGFVARAFCHELDHLDGILYIDKADMLTEEEIKEMFEE